MCLQNKDKQSNLFTFNYEIGFNYDKKSSLHGFSECRMVVHSPTDHPNSFPVIFCLLPHWLFKPVKRSEEHAGVAVCAINTRTQEVEAGSSLEAT